MIRDNGKVKIAVFLFFLSALAMPSHAQSVDFTVSGRLDWQRGELSAEASYRLAQAGIRLPSERFLGEEILRANQTGLLRPYILSIRVDSSSTIQSLVERRELSLNDIDNISQEAAAIPPFLSQDLSGMTGRYTLFLGRIAALLTRHRQAAEPERPIIQVPAADYTGIIIIADRELPVHGRNTRALVEPCVFPKIWDSNMNLVYDHSMTESAGVTGSSSRGYSLMVRYTTLENIFRATPSGLEEDLAVLVGANPLRILAAGVFGINPTDPVIAADDALKILSGENNRRLLREGRVVLVLSEQMLSVEMPPVQITLQ